MSSRWFVSDSARGMWCSIGALPVSVPVAETWLANDREGLAGSFVPHYLVFWPTFTVLYLGWTHLSYARRDPRELLEVVRRETVSRSRWWNRWAGTDDASSLTLAAAVVAVVVTLSVAQVPEFRTSTLSVLLGLATVAASWALMVYSFALEYLRLDSALRAQGRPHLEFDAEPGVDFGDYLTFALLASTMAATISASVGSRAIWRKVRTNVLLAFAFNSVVVAMMVSLLFGGLVG